jgi:hypothetical protein
MKNLALKVTLYVISSLARDRLVFKYVPEGGSRAAHAGQPIATDGHGSQEFAMSRPTELGLLVRQQALCLRLGTSAHKKSQKVTFGLESVHKSWVSVKIRKYPPPPPRGFRTLVSTSGEGKYGNRGRDKERKCFKSCNYFINGIDVKYIHVGGT